jgi:hypothetical protein
MTPQDSLLVITGGLNATSLLSSTETYPRSSDCSLPSLPLGRFSHTTFVTSEPTALIATCGGNSGGPTDSCLVLDPINQGWDESRMGSLTMKRDFGAAATLNHIGVFILGGSTGNNDRTSEFLAAGTMQWQEGPALPEGNWIYPCSVEITPNSFLIIERRDIREFNAAIAGPTSTDGWRHAGRWPSLKTYRSYQPGCAKIGQKVIIAGGYDEGALRSSEVLDLVNRSISPGQEMATPRMSFHLATIFNAGENKIYALGGNVDSTCLYSVEEWVEESSSWKPADNLVEKRSAFGAVVASKALVCP